MDYSLKIYGILQMFNTAEDSVKRKWALAINDDISERDWVYVSCFVYKFSANAAVQENLYKLLH